MKTKILLAVCIVVTMALGLFAACSKSAGSGSPPGNNNSGSTSSNSDLGSPDTTSCSSETGVAKVVCLAESFLSTLSTDQKSQVVVALNLTNAKRWSNLPCALSCRNGLLLGSLSSTQLSAALAVIKAAAGVADGDGYGEFQTIRAADDYLNASGGGGSYGDGNYVIAFLGTPTATGKWMLQYGGHHYASNITFDAGSVVSITPLHEGVEPHTSFTINDSTYSCPLTSELEGMQNMLASFSSTELGSAKISGTFSDCLMVPGSTTNTMPSTKQGIKVGSLSAAAQQKVWAAMQPWINDIDSTQDAAIRNAYYNELADTYVCYASNAGATTGKPGSFFTTNTDYVRIDGPSVWIEFICQTGVIFSNQIHYHTVMRDHSRDYVGL